MKKLYHRIKSQLRDDRGEITIFACFFVAGVIMLISFLLLYASIHPSALPVSISAMGQKWN